MRTKLKAFTLTELLIALAVIGILVAILFPVIFNILPDQNALMAKRAYYTVQTVISDIINDEGCYPVKADDDIGFNDGSGYINCPKFNNTNNNNAFDKFVKLFTDKVDIKGDVTNITNGAKFNTKDGITWTIFNSTAAQAYNNSVDNMFAAIMVDVNGNKDPGCGQSALTGENTKNLTKGFDQFAITVGQDGKLVILDGWARSAVKVNKDITGEDEDDETTILPNANNPTENQQSNTINQAGENENAGEIGLTPNGGK